MMHRNRLANSTRPRGFTLIELLVVIAIIAILAAILFPVFAQAKAAANKAAAISNSKQYALAMQMYMGDNDDVMCIANPCNARYANGVFSLGRINGYTPPVQYAQSNGWLVEVFPYVKEKTAFNNPNAAEEYTINYGAQTSQAEFDYAAGFSLNITMNGYMNGLSSSVVAYPSLSISGWQGDGFCNVLGGTYMVTPLALPITGTPVADFYAPLVQFQRSGATCTVGWLGNWGAWNRSYYVYGQGFIACKMDGSAKWYRAVGGLTTSPFRFLTSGVPGRWDGTTEGANEVGGSNGYYLNQDPNDGPAGCTYGYFFSPDRDQ